MRLRVARNIRARGEGKKKGYVASSSGYTVGGRAGKRRAPDVGSRGPFLDFDVPYIHHRSPQQR